MVARFSAQLRTLLLLLTIGRISGAIEVPWQAYHKTSQVLDLFKSASTASSNLARYQDIPDPTHDSELSLPLVTVTDFKTGETGKEVIFLVAGEHARELITSEIIFWLYQILTGNDKEFLAWPAASSFTTRRKQLGLGSGSLQDWIQDLLQKVVFKAVPIANIEGRKAVEKGDSCLRTTYSGVDLNRNWATAWQQKEPGSEDYGGPKPFSEPESRIVKLIAEGSPLRSHVNIHSGEYALYVPWDSKAEYAPHLTADVQVVLEQLNVWCQCMHGAGGKVAGYLAYGTSMDYMYEELHVPYPLTFEVYGPQGLGKLEMGGHPRRLTQEQALTLQQAQQDSRNAAQAQQQAQQDSRNAAQAQQQAQQDSRNAAQAQQQQQQDLQGQTDRQQQQQQQQQQLASQQDAQQQKPPVLKIANEQQQQQQQQQGVLDVRKGEQQQVASGAQKTSLQQGSMAGQQASAGVGHTQAKPAAVTQDTPAKESDCFSAFNPPSVAEYQEVIVTWVATILTLADHLAKHPIASHAAQDAEQQQQPLPKGSTYKMDLARRIGSDEEQQLLKTAKDDLNISSASHAGDQSLESVTVIDTLQHHSPELLQDGLSSSPKRSSYLYPVLLVFGCFLVLCWRRLASPKISWSKRRVAASRYQV